MAMAMEAMTMPIMTQVGSPSGGGAVALSGSAARSGLNGRAGWFGNEGALITQVEH